METGGCMINAKRGKFVYSIFLFTLTTLCSAWTWTYKKDFALNNADKVAYFNQKTRFFKQLIFSWNAHRPPKGYFKFSVSVHTSSGWSKWFETADWGAGIQQSYLSKDKDIAFYHVRLEIPNRVADAFKIKIESIDGVDLSLLKIVTVSVSNKELFEPEKYNDLKDLKSVYIKNIPIQSQMVLRHEDKDRICSPTSLSMLVGYLDKKRLDPLKVAKNSFDDGLQVYGSWPFNIAHAFELFPKCKFSVVRLSSFKSLHEYLTKGIPVVVSIRGNLKTAAKDYPNGHLVLVNGWSREKKLIHVHDPAFKRNSQVKHSYRVNDFLKAWENSYRLAYVVDCG